MGMEPLNVRVPPELKEEIEDWADENGYSRSEGARRLLKRAIRDHYEVHHLDQRVDDLEGVEQRVDDLEQRVDDLERLPSWLPW